MHFQVNIHSDAEKGFVHNHKAGKKRSWNSKPRILFLNLEFCSLKLSFLLQEGLQTDFCQMVMWCRTHFRHSSFFFFFSTFRTLMLTLTPPPTHLPLCPSSWGGGWVLIQLCISHEWGAGQMIDSGCFGQLCVLKFVCWTPKTWCHGIWRWGR